LRVITLLRTPEEKGGGNKGMERVGGIRKWGEGRGREGKGGD